MKRYRVWHKKGYDKAVEIVEATSGVNAKAIIQEKYPDHTVTKVWLAAK